ncbi:MAG: beta-glucosidase [Bacilli bacterium]
MKTKKMTLEEKIKLVTGKDLWHVDDLGGKLPTLSFADGPCGLRKMRLNEHGWWEDIPANAYVSLGGIANSWNKDLAKLQGALIADDCIEAEVDVLLAPGVNIKRTPLCGRNFEYFSEDPLLTGILAKAFIEGVQEKGIGTSLKHFVANNREIRRFNQSSEVDERTLHEIYAEAFRIALQANPFSVMMSYNPVNGIYASENAHLIKDILRDEFKFKNLVISDWMGVHNSAKALKAGNNLRMPFDKKAAAQIKEGLKEGVISEADLDENVAKILDALQTNEVNKKLRKIEYSPKERLEKSLQIAHESIVLLKNNGVLPLKKDKTIFLSGELDEKPYISGSGSAKVRSCITQKRISAILQDDGHKCIRSQNNFLDSCNPSHFDRETVKASIENDITILLVGNSDKIEGEGFDRETIRLSEKEETLIKQTAKVANELIIVIEAGSAIDMSEWIDDVSAVIFAGFLGDNTNQAIADILSGKVNPSGKLSETFPYIIEDTYCQLDTGRGSYEEYTDKLLVGYRWFDQEEIEPLFEFGFGLSYTNFAYSDLKVEKISEDSFAVTYKIKNIGDIPGKEISQVYVSSVSSMVPRERKALKGFSKELINPGQTKTVKIVLDAHAFAYYDVNNREYYVENGYYDILIGASSRDIRLTQRVKIQKDSKTQHSIY